MAALPSHPDRDPLIPAADAGARAAARALGAGSTCTCRSAARAAPTATSPRDGTGRGGAGAGWRRASARSALARRRAASGRRPAFGAACSSAAARPAGSRPAHFAALVAGPRRARCASPRRRASVTLEANPEDVDDGAARGLARGGRGPASRSARSRSTTTSCGGSGASTVPAARRAAVGRGCAAHGVDRLEPRPHVRLPGAHARALAARRSSARSRSIRPTSRPTRSRRSRERRWARRCCAGRAGARPTTTTRPAYFELAARVLARGGLPSLRGLELRAPGPRGAAQPGLLAAARATSASGPRR